MSTSIPTPGSEQLQQSSVLPPVPVQEPPAVQEIPQESEQTLDMHAWVDHLARRYQTANELLDGPLPDLPTPFDLSRVQRILDVACGTGNWVHEMAQCYPGMQLFGVDASMSAIEAAQKMCADIPNCTFLAQELQNFEAGPFLPNSFDLVHLAFTLGEITREQYPTLVQSLARCSRPGGLLVWREAELPLTSSDACDHLEALILGALQATGRAFSPGFFLSLGITPWMHYWLHHAGYRIISEKRDLIDIAKGTKAHHLFCDEVWAFVQRARSFLLDSGVTTSAILENLLTQVQIEIREKGFCGLWPVHTIVGVKRK